ncbi:hypothetical protein Tco_0586640 [Tanacetum coccineum]
MWVLNQRPRSEICSSIDENGGREDGLLDCGVIPGNCLPCLAAMVSSVEKRSRRDVLIDSAINLFRKNTGEEITKRIVDEKRIKLRIGDVKKTGNVIKLCHMTCHQASSTFLDLDPPLPHRHKHIAHALRSK